MWTQRKLTQSHHSSEFSTFFPDHSRGHLNFSLCRTNDFWSNSPTQNAVEISFPQRRFATIWIWCSKMMQLNAIAVFYTGLIFTTDFGSVLRNDAIEPIWVDSFSGSNFAVCWTRKKIERKTVGRIERAIPGVRPVFNLCIGPRLPWKLIRKRTLFTCHPTWRMFDIITAKWCSQTAQYFDIASSETGGIASWFHNFTVVRFVHDLLKEIKKQLLTLRLL